MYKDHKCFISPEIEDAKIWRYIDFSKYVSMLDKSSLYFVRADKLNDPFEGSFTNANVKHRPQVYADTGIPPEGMAQIFGFFKATRAFTTINSWHMNDFESTAMWKLYANQGIGILSTFKRLKDSFRNVEQDIFIGKVTYVDWDKYYIPEGNTFFPYVHKRKSFEYEQELRAIYAKLPQNEKGIDVSKPVWENGLEIQVDLNILVDKIYLSPLTPNWIYDLIKSITKKYGYEWQIDRSSLDASPVY